MTFFNDKTDGKEDWITPRSIIESLGEFDLDPCCSMTQPYLIGKINYNKNDNGLEKEWIGRVFLNPPYGNKTGLWLKKLSNHRNGTALIFARTETKMFFDYVCNSADSILFLKGRVTFLQPCGNLGKFTAGAPSCLIAYGEENTKYLKNSNLKGKFIKLCNNNYTIMEK